MVNPERRALVVLTFMYFDLNYCPLIYFSFTLAE